MTASRDSDSLAFLFDLDGTLVDSVYQHVLAWREATQAVGIELPVWRIHRQIGMSGGLMLHAPVATSRAAVPASNHYVLGRVPVPGTGTNAHESVRRRVQQEPLGLTIDGISRRGAEGERARRGCSRGRDRSPCASVPSRDSAARGGLPHVPVPGGARTAEAAGRLHVDRAGGDGRAHGTGPRRSRPTPRNTTLEFILVDHRLLDCPVCDRGRRVPAAGPDVPLRARATRA